MSDATEPNQPIVHEAGFFARHPDGFKVHAKVAGDAQIHEDLDEIIRGYKERGYTPEEAASKGGGTAGASSSSSSPSSDGGDKPTKFEVNGVTWYVNFSRAKSKHYISRGKGQDIQFLDWKEAPANIRQAYGK